MRWGYSILTGLLGPIVRRLWIEKVEGLDNIPDEGPVIVASNHLSYFDFICFMAISPRPIHYLAAETFYRNLFWKPLIWLTSQIYVDRTKQYQKSTYDAALSLLEGGQVLGIFPEGTRSSDGKLQKAFPGVAYLAIGARAPIVPVGMIGTYEIMSRHERLPRLKKCQIRIGRPIHPNFFPQIGQDKSIYHRLTDHVMQEIAALTGQDYPYAGHAPNRASGDRHRRVP